MKYPIGLASILVVLVSCGKTEQAWDKLTDDERAYLATQATQKCLADTQDPLLTYIQKSNDAFGTEQYKRNATWKHEWKTGDSAATRTYKFTSWKQDAGNLYFIITKDTSEGDTTYEFLKITKATNQAMIEDLREKHCASKLNTNVTATSFRATSSSYTTENTIYTSTVNPVEKKKTIDTFSFSSNLPAYFGRFSEKKIIQTLDGDDRVKTTTTTTGTFVAVADSAPIYALYTQYTPSLTQYCYMEPTSGSSYSIPYELTCKPFADVDTSKFDPKELCRIDETNCSF